MRRREKGISMISLVVVIISIIILTMIAITAGYRFITQSQEAEKTALINLISEAAYRRQNDFNVDVASYYAGTAIDEENITPEHFKNLPDDFNDKKTKIHTDLNGTEPIWFVLDRESAEELGITGIDDYDKYIVDKFTNMTPNDDSHYSPVAIVEYITGTAFLVDAQNNFVNSLNPSDHAHVYSVATCYTPSTCKICGNQEGTALPHLIVGNKKVEGSGEEARYIAVDGDAVYDNEIAALVADHTYKPTCTQALTCKRCGTVFEKATGHSFPETNQYGFYSLADYSRDANKHWIECLNGCGTKKVEEVHTKNYIPADGANRSKYHIQNCSICGWESAMTEHRLVIENVDATHHKVYCTLCDYSETHQDDGWHYDRDEHWKVCEECNPDDDDHKILEEGHKDENGDHVCDVCGRYLDSTPPKAFDDGDITVELTTTHQIKVKAKTEDDEYGQGIAYYEFSIDNGATWQKVNVSSDDQAAEYQYNNLIHNHDYVVLVRVTDKGENVTQGSIRVNTYEVPAQAVVSSIAPQTITGGAVSVTLTMPTISLPQEAKDQLKIVYKIDGESTNWIDYTSPIQVNKEAPTVILTKIVDKRSPEPNSSRIVSTVNVTNIDKTPPTVTVEATGSTVSSTSHDAVIRIKDEKAGIAAGTTVEYAWSTSSTTPPSSWQTTTTGEAGKEVTVKVTSPSGVEGTYYLWVKSGVKDAVGNPTVTNVKGSMSFSIDDVAPTLTVRTMRNKASDAVDELYVKTGGTITINMTSNKKLTQGPLVRIGAKEVRATTTGTAGTAWVATIVVDESLAEGLLNNVKFSDYISYSGKAGTEYTTTSDGKYITYDKTLPELDYVNKGGVTASADSIVNHLLVGDYVKYVADSGTWTPDPSKTGSSNTTPLTTNTSTLWRVWEVTKRGVTLIPMYAVNTLYLGTNAHSTSATDDTGATYGAAAFVNGPSLMDEISRTLYSKSGYTSNVRHMTYEDIQEKLKTPFTPSGTNYAYYDKNDSSYTSGTVAVKGKTYTKTKPNPTLYNGITEPRYYTWDTGEGITYESSQFKKDSNNTPYIVPTAGHPVYVTYTACRDSIAADKWEDVTDSHVNDATTYGKILGTGFSWLASSSVALNSNQANLFMRLVLSDWLESAPQGSTGGQSNASSYGLRPMVTLKSSVEIDTTQTTRDGSTSAKAWILK